MAKAVKITEIVSPQNAHFKRWRQLLHASGIKKHGEMLIAGEKIIREAIQSSAIKVKSVLIQRRDVAYERGPLFAELNRYALSAELFDQLNELNTPGPILIAEAPTLPKADLLKVPDGLELLLALQDPSNLGAALRLAEAFSARVVLLSECAHPFLPKTIRASSGSALRVPMSRGPSIRHLKEHLDPNNAALVQLDLSGEDISRFRWPRQARLLVGVEGPGLPPELSDLGSKVNIPIRKGMDSLNALSALSIAVYAYRVQHPLAGG